MGSGIVIGLVFVVVVGLLVVAGAAAGRKGMQDQARKQEWAKSDSVETLRYSVPVGQDPAAVMAALRREGFEPAGDTDSSAQDVLVPCRSEADRDRVRRAIAGAGLNLEGDHEGQGEGRGQGSAAARVRFADE